MSLFSLLISSDISYCKYLCCAGSLLQSLHHVHIPELGVMKMGSLWIVSLSVCFMSVCMLLPSMGSFHNPAVVFSMMGSSSLMLVAFGTWSKWKLLLSLCLLMGIGLIGASSIDRNIVLPMLVGPFMMKVLIFFCKILII